MEDSFQSTVPEEAKNKEEGGGEGGPLCILKRINEQSIRCRLLGVIGEMRTALSLVMCNIIH